MKNKLILLTTLFVALITLSSQCNKEKIATENEELTALEINLDQTAWFCQSNCRYNFAFSEGNVTVKRYDKPNDEQPLWQCDRKLPSADWQAILKVLDIDALAQVEETIGCPGCADAPIETLKVTTGQFSKEVRMEVQDKVPAIQDFLDELRVQAEEYRAQENCQ